MNIKLNKKEGCGFGEWSGAEQEKNVIYSPPSYSSAASSGYGSLMYATLHIKDSIQGHQLDKSDQGIKVDGAPVYPRENFWLFICLVLCISGKMNS
jgi:hypothetical protein